MPVTQPKSCQLVTIPREHVGMMSLKHAVRSFANKLSFNKRVRLRANLLLHDVSTRELSCWSGSENVHEKQPKHFESPFLVWKVSSMKSKVPIYLNLSPSSARASLTAIFKIESWPFIPGPWLGPSIGCANPNEKPVTIEKILVGETFFCCSNGEWKRGEKEHRTAQMVWATKINTQSQSGQFGSLARRCACACRRRFDPLLSISISSLFLKFFFVCEGERRK